MWARWCEVVLGLWLLASTWIVADGARSLATNVACGALAVVFALASFRRRWHLAHLGSLLVAAWLCVHGWLGTREVAHPVAQNEILVGLLLATFALVPSEASRPPLPWRDAANG